MAAALLGFLSACDICYSPELESETETGEITWMTFDSKEKLRQEIIRSYSDNAAKLT